MVHQAVVPGARHVAAQAAYTREPVVNVEVGSGTAGLLFRKEIDDLGLKTLMVIPLIVQRELQGVMEVLSIHERDYVARQLDVLTVVANDLASGMNRKRLMDELRMKNLELENQTQKTVEASDTLKKFLAMFSHELRSPLNSIIGFSDLSDHAASPS